MLVTIVIIMISSMVFAHTVIFYIVNKDKNIYFIIFFLILD